ncbi:DUF3798 domain-containing protein [Abyssisolibacter fermentans]|uniref:DUF3798 domain-containing protein n=1 Tax=Abyssisolibacter fermentans TaxID=1766203 RepID=UPI000834FD9F|nr:DUF3798 domain-containing protein [Abyssisolibacter fermentans]
MLKRLLVTLLVFIMIFSLAACNGKEVSNDNDGKWKIGIMTGTVSQNEEEYRAAQRVQEKYGKDRVLLQTFPDQFMKEQETVIQNVMTMASDQDLKVIIICQAIPGTCAAIDKVKEIRDDILFIVGSVAEDPKMISSKADVIFQIDELGMGPAVPKQAQKMGAKVFVHYSFPRHMSYALLSKRRDMFREECEKLGIKFVEATAPDPTGDAGISGTQQFILEDVPRKVAKYGKDTNFFSTNCAMMEPLIRSVLNEKAIFAQQCCPSPYHGYPGALGIEIPEDKKGSVDYIIDEISKKVENGGNKGRMSTWPVPMAMMFIEAGAEYAVDYIKGNTDGKLDIDKIKEHFKEYADADMQITPYHDDETGKTYENYLMILSDFIDF